jgi:hypothetical protein
MKLKFRSMTLWYTALYYNSRVLICTVRQCFWDFHKPCVNNLTADVINICPAVVSDPYQRPLLVFVRLELGGYLLWAHRDPDTPREFLRMIWSRTSARNYSPVAAWRLWICLSCCTLFSIFFFKFAPMVRDMMQFGTEVCIISFYRSWFKSNTLFHVQNISISRFMHLIIVRTGSGRQIIIILTFTSSCSEYPPNSIVQYTPCTIIIYHCLTKLWPNPISGSSREQQWYFPHHPCVAASGLGRTCRRLFILSAVVSPQFHPTYIRSAVHQNIIGPASSACSGPWGPGHGMHAAYLVGRLITYNIGNTL